MERKFRSKKGNRSLIACAAMGAGIGMLNSLLLTVLTSMLISSEKLPEEFVRYIGIGIMAISTFLAVQVGGRLSFEMKLLNGGIAALVYYLLLVASAILFFDGVFSSFAANTIAFLLSCGLSMLLLMVHTNRGVQKKRRMFSR